MTYLLDVNILVALIDPGHVAHNAAHAWFERFGRGDWATYPLTENGRRRPSAISKYAWIPGGRRGNRLHNTKSSGHSFWPDDFSLVASDNVDPTRILTSAQVTDTYLLALARSKGGRLATFDRRLSVAAVRRGKAALHLISGD